MLVFIVDDILLDTSSFSLFKEAKDFLSNYFDMKVMGESHFVIGIEALCDRFLSSLWVSQRTYISNVLQGLLM